MLLAVVLTGTVGAFLASRYRPLLLAVVSAFVGVFFVAQYAELLDPQVGSQLRAEAGAFYTFMSWSGPFFVVVGGLIGLLVRRGTRTSGRGPSGI